MASGDWQRFLSAYYVANALVLASYLFIRVRFQEHGPNPAYSRLFTPAGLLSKEWQAFPTLLVALGVKYIRRQSLDGFLADAFFYTRLVLGVLLFYVDARLLAAFLTVSLILFLVLPQPIYKGPTKVQTFTPVSFKETVLDAPELGVEWLVEFFAPWSPACVHLEPVLAEISSAFTTDKLRFGKVDVSKWPAVGEQFKVSASSMTQQLPTLVLFEKGKEAARIPHVYPDGSVAKGRFRKRDIVVGFDLESRSSRQQEAKPEPAPKAGARKRR